jgi:acyl carrier protein
MKEEEIYAELGSIFAEVLGMDAIALRPETTAEDVPGWDSLTHLKLLFTIQKRFGIEFETAEIIGMKNVGEMVRIIEERSRC